MPETLTTHEAMQLLGLTRRATFNDYVTRYGFVCVSPGGGKPKGKYSNAPGLQSTWEAQRIRVIAQALQTLHPR